MILDIIVKSTLVLGVAALFSVMSRGRATAALRHAVWVAALIGAVLVPALSAALPALRVPLLPNEFRPAATAQPSTAASVAGDAEPLPSAEWPESTAPVPAAAAVRPSAASLPVAAALPEAGLSVVEDTRVLLRALRDRVSGIPLLTALWMLGAVLLCVRVIASRLSAARVTRTRVPGRAPWLPAARRLARIMRVPRRLRFLRSDRVAMPMAYGVLRPAVVLPTEADDWSADRLQAVLLHELSHVRRRDCLTQAAADLALAALWFHPLAWVARRAIRRERERACDDLVLAAGTPAPEYASHLLDVARDARQRSASLALSGGVAMARPSELEGRLMAILDDTRPRRALTVRSCATVGLVTLAIVAPTSALDLWQAPGAATHADAVPASPTERPRPDTVGLRLESAPATPRVAASAGAVAVAGAVADAQEPMPMPSPAPAPSPSIVAAPVVATTIAMEHDFDFEHDVELVESIAPAAMAAVRATTAGLIAPAFVAQAPVAGVPGGVKGGVVVAAPAKRAASRTPPDPKVVAALTEALKDSDKEVRQQALQTLSRFRDPSTIDALIGVMSHTDPDMRRQAVFALSNIRDPRTQSALAGALKDQDAQVRRHALFALARQKDPAAYEPLVAATKDADPDVRKQAAFSLGELRDARAAGPLGALVADANVEVRQQAVFALGQLRSTETIAPLQTALKDSDDKVRERAAFALGQIRDPRAVEALMAATRDTSITVRKQAYFALGQVGDARAQDLAIAGLKDSDPEVRRMAAFALSRMTDRD